ncbi:MAG TPA: heme A synthase [Rhodospirillaceae bacterium]|nr:heme A synthase [Rhodospirillaceae bacterium]
MQSRYDCAVQNKSLSNFLFLIAAMVLIMAVIGAATRLTESGLSIVEWKPISGAIPPMTEMDWQQEFQTYQSSPQFQKVNQHMTLAEFKNIFWWEWVHRQWGRLIGLVYAAGLVWFWLRKQIPVNYKKPLIGLLLLGGAQGLMGWLMVKSGLVDDPAVSHYRLAAHLFLAVLIYIWALWLAISIRRGLRQIALEKPKMTPLQKHSIATLCVVLLTVIWGAFVAGLDAGLLYNTWPSMDGYFSPPDFWHLSPAWLNFFENHGAVQFIHRMLAYLAVLMCIAIGVMTFVRKIPAARTGYAIAAMGILQVLLGIITLLTQVHLHVAVTHQAGAFVLIGLLVMWLQQLRHRSP